MVIVAELIARGEGVELQRVAIPQIEAVVNRAVEEVHAVHPVNGLGLLPVGCAKLMQAVLDMLGMPVRQCGGQAVVGIALQGHIRKEDIEGKDIFDWAKREFEEEIAYDGNVEIETLGLLNDESNDVGTVHTGFVLLLKGDSPNIKIRSELQSGQLLTLSACKTYYEQMENWSKFVFDFLHR